LVASLITDIIGIHSIFGAFISGLVIPRRHGFEISLTEKIEDLVTVLFLPLFFAYSGLKTNIGLLNSGIAWASVLLVILTACSGKIVGCAGAARMLKMNWRESLSIGVLMNTKVRFLDFIAYVSI
jgi:Kef-type K+ transport system membrane component KefB